MMEMSLSMDEFSMVTRVLNEEDGIGGRWWGWANEKS